MDEPVPGVTMIDTEERPMCVVDDSCFIPPANYTVMGKTLLSFSKKISCACLTVEQSFDSVVIFAFTLRFFHLDLINSLTAGCVCIIDGTGWTKPLV